MYGRRSNSDISTGTLATAEKLAMWKAADEPAAPAPVNWLKHVIVQRENKVRHTYDGDAANMRLTRRLYLMERILEGRWSMSWMYR
jgi:hypothetical protein